MSSLSITAFTIERYIGICHPYRAQSICTVQRAKRIIGALWLFSLVYNSAWLYLATVKPFPVYRDIPDAERCTFRIKRKSSEYQVVYMVDFLLFYFIPLLLYLLLYGRITVELISTSQTRSESMLESTTRKRKSFWLRRQRENDERTAQYSLVTEHEGELEEVNGETDSIRRERRNPRNSMKEEGRKGNSMKEEGRKRNRDSFVSGQTKGRTQVRQRSNIISQSESPVTNYHRLRSAESDDQTEHDLIRIFSGCQNVGCNCLCFWYLLVSIPGSRSVQLIL